MLRLSMLPLTLDPGREGLSLSATCRLTSVPVGLQRRIRRAGHSVVVTLPSQLAELADLEEGDIVEFEYLGQGALRISPVRGYTEP